MSQPSAERLRSPPAVWRFPQPYGVRTVAVIVVALLVLWHTGQRLGMGEAAVLTGEGIAAAVGLPVESQVARGFSAIARQLFPLQISERTEISRIESFDRNQLPLFSRIEVEPFETRTLDPDTLQMKTTRGERGVLVEPVGYLAHVCVKLLETLEIALWGTLLAVVIGAPLAVLGARNLAPSRALRVASHTIVSWLRAVPELISALFFVLAYGFGPVAGVLALALHAAGFLGKFYAEDIENADPKPQEALQAIGANRLKILRYAILPQVMPQYIGYTLYILDRNVRMATVIGLVGAGGIGQELKGRYDMYHYGHVGTILLAIFALVFLLDQLSGRLRRHYL